MSVFAFPKESRSVDNDLIWSASLASFERIDNRRTSSGELVLFPDAVIPLQSVRVRSPHQVIVCWTHRKITACNSALLLISKYTRAARS